MDIEAYILERLDPQIAWYDSKSGWNQVWYRRLRFGEIAIACSLSFLVSYADTLAVLKILAGLLGVGVAIIAGILSLFRFQETWIEYRSICEALKREKFLFQARAEPYASDGAAAVFVARAEALMGQEHTAWSERMAQRGEPPTSS
ncbi:MAG TPA: DUF4231 domain-containing protein [Candidatus Methylomirabilis sp.]|nr:DUF4231 domain-containing protein [Candidatus Methylomirabilis sp.]